MGRYYFGTISGKFWVCIQDSDDASYFKSAIIFSTPLRCFEYMGCCCFVKNIYDLYCTKCYNSFEEHVESIDDEYLLEDIKNNNNLIYQNNYIKYYFENFELEYVKTKLNKLEKQIGQEIIDNIKLTIYDENNEQIDINNKIEKQKKKPSFAYDLNDTILKDLDEDQKKIIAKWCLGKLIEHSIKELGYCEIYCEI
jgi:hypothetical protein